MFSFVMRRLVPPAIGVPAAAAGLAALGVGGDLFGPTLGAALGAGAGAAAWLAFVVSTARDTDQTWRDHRGVVAGALEREARLRLMMQGLEHHALLRISAEGRIAWASASIQQVAGVPPAELIGRSCSVLFCAEDVAAGLPFERLQKAAREGAVDDVGTRTHVARGAFRVDAVLTAVRDDHGALVGFIEVLHPTDGRAAAPVARQAVPETAAHAPVPYMPPAEPPPPEEPQPEAAAPQTLMDAIPEAAAEEIAAEAPDPSAGLDVPTEVSRTQEHAAVMAEAPGLSFEDAVAQRAPTQTAMAAVLTTGERDAVAKADAATLDRIFETATWNQISAFDPRTLVRQVGDDRNLLIEFARDCASEHAALFSQLQEAMEDRDAVRAEEVAHRLTGSLQSLSANNAAQIAVAIEQAAQRREIANGALKLPPLQAELDRLQADLRVLGQISSPADESAGA